MNARKMVWADQQPTIVERLLSDEFKTRGKDVTGNWAHLQESKNKRGYTLEETPTMSFKGSGNLPAHYYMPDAEELEAEFVAQLAGDGEIIVEL